MPITDLTGYTWVGNDVLILPSGEPELIELVYNVQFSCANPSISGGKIIAQQLVMDYFPFLLGGLYYIAPGQEKYLSLVAACSGEQAEIGMLWLDPKFKEITFLGGEDATNEELIQWLTENGTFIARIIVKYGDKILFNRDSSLPLSIYYGEQLVVNVNTKESLLMLTKGRRITAPIRIGNLLLKGLGKIYIEDILIQCGEVVPNKEDITLIKFEENE